MPVPTSLKRRLLDDLPHYAHRAAAVLPTAAQSPQTLFNIDGGPILLLGLWGRVTTACDATVTTFKFSADPDDSAAQDLSTAVAITSDAVDTLWHLGATVGAALNVASVAIALTLLTAPGWFVSPGIITCTTSATNVGQAEYYMRFIKLHDQAVVKAA
jgi:hypothetical protein